MLDWIIVWLVVFMGVSIVQLMINFFQDNDDSNHE